MKIRILGHTMTGIAFLTRAFIFLGVVLFIGIIKYIRWGFKEEADIELGKFFKMVLNKLPETDFDSLIMRGKLLSRYRHTSTDAQRIIREIVEFGEKNFTREGKEVLNSTVPLFIDELDKGFAHSKAISIKDVLNYSNYEIFRHYVLSISGNDDQKNSKKYWVSIIVDIILFIPFVIFAWRPSYFAIVLNILSVIASIAMYKLLDKHLVAFSILSVLVHWLASFTIIAMSPLYLFRRLSKGWFIGPILFLIFFAMVGFWIAQEIWKYTDYEKRNINTFIAHNKFPFVLEIKYMPKIRYIALWLICVSTIFGTILTYAAIYRKLLNNLLYYCLLLSMSIYLGTGYFSVDSIGLDSVEHMYLLSEAMVAFLLNTFYIAYIANLMFMHNSKQK